MNFAQRFKLKMNEHQLSHFKTPSNLPFMFYTSKQTTFKGETFPQMTLNLGSKPIIETPSLEDLWTTVNNPNIQRKRVSNCSSSIKSEHELHRMFAANIIANDVARRSRRAAANILIVPNKTEKDWFDETYTRFKYQRMTVVVDPTLEPNELRATYWKIMYKRERVGDNVITTDIPAYVDGGLQLSPEGFSCIQKEGDCWIDYHSYFARGFM